MKDFLRVRIKGDDDRAGPPQAGLADDPLQDLLMGQVDAVEVADGDDGGSKFRCYVPDAFKNLHEKRNRCPYL